MTSSSSRSEFLNSPESSFSDEADRIRVNILRHVQRMANPVWSKQSQTQLLDLKQKHASAFQDICLYSQVCQLLGKSTYRLGSRRFLQELFLDLDFDTFYRELEDICSSKSDHPLPEEAPMNGVVPGTQSPVKTKANKPTIANDSSNISVRTNNSTKVNHAASNKQPNSTVEVEHSKQTRSKTPPLTPTQSAIEGGTNANTIGKPLHLRSPPLASLYETSVENIAEMSSTPKESALLRVQAAIGQIEKVTL